MGEEEVIGSYRVCPNDGVSRDLCSRYLRECWRGGPIVGRLLDTHVDLYRGTFAFVLPYVPKDHPVLDPSLSFSAQVHGSGDNRSCDGNRLLTLAQALKRALDMGAGLGLIVDYLSTPSDPLLENWAAQPRSGPLVVVQVDGDIYYPLYSNQLASEMYDILEFCETVAPFFGIVSRTSANILDAHSSRWVELSEYDLVEIVRGTVFLFSGAFDGEGYLLWTDQKESTMQEPV